MTFQQSIKPPKPITTHVISIDLQVLEQVKQWVKRNWNTCLSYNDKIGLLCHCSVDNFLRFQTDWKKVIQKRNNILSSRKFSRQLHFHPLLLKLHFDVPKDAKIQVNVAKDMYSYEGCFLLLPSSQLNHPQRFVKLLSPPFFIWKSQK